MLIGFGSTKKNAQIKTRIPQKPLVVNADERSIVRNSYARDILEYDITDALAANKSF
jgi:hypothetical protein